VQAGLPVAGIVKNVTVAGTSVSSSGAVGAPDSLGNASPSPSDNGCPFRFTVRASRWPAARIKRSETAGRCTVRVAVRSLPRHYMRTRQRRAATAHRRRGSALNGNRPRTIMSGRLPHIILPLSWCNKGMGRVALLHGGHSSKCLLYSWGISRIALQPIRVAAAGTN
jgi:hypothetical protein